MAPYTISSTTHHRDEAALTLLAHVTETSRGHTSKISGIELRISDLEEAGINSLGDVDTTTNSPNIEQVLEWDGTNWVPGDKRPPPTGSSGDVIIADGLGGIDSTSKLNVNQSNGTITGLLFNVDELNIKVGSSAGNGASGNGNISIGYQTGTNAGNFAVAIGALAGQNGGINSVSLGFNAAANDINCIVINGSGTLTQSLQTGSCYINPVRNLNATTLTNPFVVQYDDTNKEVIKSEDLHIRDIQNNGTLTNVGTASLFNGQLTLGTTVHRAIVGAPNAILSVDLQNRRVGINVLNPTEDLDVDGNIQLNSSTTSRIVFYDTNDDHEHAEIDATDDGANGGQLQFHTKVNAAAVSEKLRINNVGAIGLGGANYGTTGQVIVSRGENNPVEWADQTDTTYTDGVGINLDGTVINNTAPDQIVVLNQAGATTITGAYPTFTISSTDTNTTYTAGSNMQLSGTEFNIPQSVATTAFPAFSNIQSPGVYNSGGRVSIGPLTFAYPRFNVGGPNAANEAYLSNIMNNGYYFRIRGHPTNQGQMHFNANGNITCNSAFVPASDDRLKHNETTITKALHLIRQLVPKKYEKTETMLPADYKGTLPEGMNYVIEAGFIAQEVKKIPDLSFAVNGGDYEDEKEDGTKELKAHPFNLNYDTIFTYATAAVQELDGVVQQQAQLISSLEARLSALENN